MIFCFDIDGTICGQGSPPYEIPPEPFIDRINKINELYSDGHTIILFTARHWNYLQSTLKQLLEWGVKYHTVAMGKPFADVYVDDRAIDDVDFFERIK